MIGLKHPWALLLLAVIPLIWWAQLNLRRRAVLRFSGVDRLKSGPSTWSRRSRYVTPLLRCLAVALVVLSVARPQKADEETRIHTEGVALELVVDRSGSMNQEDFVNARGRTMTRLDAVKEVVRAFLLGDGEELEGRSGDLIGLTAFARYADTECPLTTDYQHLIRALDEVQVPRTRDEDGTAIGDALLLGIERIRNIARRFKDDDAFKIKSRAIILLTDGQQNAGRHEPIESAEAAAALGVKVYTIGAAPDYTVQELGGFFGDPIRIRRQVEIDEESLKKVAELTGGKYFRARDENSLREIYAEIDQLERSAVEESTYFQYEELAYQWADLGVVRLPPPLLAALILLGLEVILANTRLRKIP